MIHETDRPPAFLFNPSDFLSSADIQTWDVDVIGAYCLLLFNSWLQNPPCFLPNDEKYLQKISRLSKFRFNKVKKYLLRKFKIFDDKYIYNLRLYREYKYFKEKQLKYSNAGKKGAQNRWQRHAKTDSDANGDANAIALAIDGNLNLNHNHNLKDIREDIYKHIRTTLKLSGLPNKDDQISNLFISFLQVRKQLEKENTQLAVSQLIKKLVALSSKEDKKAEAILNYSIIKNYDDLYPHRNGYEEISSDEDITAKANAIREKYGK